MEKPQTETARREPRAIRIVEDRWETFRHIVEAVAIVAAGLWAFYTFVYQEKIKPAGEPAAMAPSIEIRRLGMDQKRELISIALVLRNTGKTEIDIAAESYAIWGVRYAASEHVSHPVDRVNEKGYQREIPVASSRLIEAFVELRDAAVGGKRGYHITIEPDSSETIGDVIAIPRGEYDMLHVVAEFVPIKTSVTKKVPISISRNANGGYWLSTGKNSGAEEDDTDSDFALIP